MKVIALFLMLCFQVMAFATEPFATCSGVVIAKDVVLTASHCLLTGSGRRTETFEAYVAANLNRASTPGAPPSAVTLSEGLLVTLSDGTTHQATVIKTGHPYHIDLAILKVNTGTIVPAKLATSPKIPDLCIHSGIGGTRTMHSMPCVVSPAPEDSQGQRTIIATPLPGDSGGPVYGRDGELIGIVCSVKMGFAGEGMVEPFYRIKEFIK